MVEPSNQSSLGARFRAAGWEEKPLQVAGAINIYTARLPSRVRNNPLRFFNCHAVRKKASSAGSGRLK